MNFYFNVHSSLLLVGFIQGVVFATLLMRRGIREERLSDRLLSLLIIVCTLHISQYMLGFAGWYDSHDWQTTFMFYFPFHHLLLLGPLIYFYLRSLTNHQFRLTRDDWWHFIPFMFSMLVYLISFVGDVVIRKWIMDIPFSIHFDTKGTIEHFTEGVPRDFIHYGTYVSILFYLFHSVQTYRNYKRYINDHFSDTESITFGWLRNILYALCIGMVGMLMIRLFNLVVSELSYSQFWTSHLVIAIMIYVVGIMGYTSVFKGQQQLEFQPNKQKGEEEEAPKEQLSEELRAWKQQLLTYMEEKKPYLDSTITLKELSRKLNTNSSILSKVINTGFEQNFNDFINAYRVKGVQQKFKENAHEQLTLMSIALDCGFNSKATFNRAFRKFSGVSPREYLAQITK
ncbi:MAG: AraC family transcriptional regulator [Bacteroidota bacterium]